MNGDVFDEESDGVEIVEDTLTVVVAFPTPEAHETISNRLQRTTQIGTQGGVISPTKTFKMEHAESGLLALGRKDGVMSNWTLRIVDPNGDERDVDARTDIGWIKDEEGLRIAANALANRLVEPAHILSEIREHKPTVADVLSVEVGETKRVISGGSKSNVDQANVMIVEAEIPMPPEFHDYTERYNKGAIRDERNDIVTVGDFTTGEIVAEREQNGSWLAIGSEDFDYKRRFSADYSLDDVALEISQDMASLEISDQAIINHVRRQVRDPEFVEAVSVAGEPFDLGEPDDSFDPV